MNNHRLLKTLGVSALAVGAVIGSALQAQTTTTPYHEGHKHHKATSTKAPKSTEDYVVQMQNEQARMQQDQAAKSGYGYESPLKFQRNTATSLEEQQKTQADKQAERAAGLKLYNPSRKGFPVPH